MKRILLLFTLVFVAFAGSSKAQRILPENHELSLVFGVTQPLVLKGFNFEIDYWTPNWIIDYSHGIGLQFTGDLVHSRAQEQQLEFSVSHTWGFGFGYRFTEGLNLRIEPKAHHWNIYYEGGLGSADQKVASYTTFTLGLGLYYRWQPFQQNEKLKGITLAPNVRWWPNVASTLDGNQLRYENQRTGQTEVHRANNIGMNNTPFFVNISVGYTF